MTSTATITARLVALSVDAVAPVQLSRFWAHALRWNVGDAGEGVAELAPADATSFRLLFRPAAEQKIGQNRIHFDLTTTSFDDQRDTVVELRGIGATDVDIGQDPSDTHVVLADPVQNEFCVIEPSNRFLASCPRLGAVNCDGTRALGHFFSHALGWPLVWDQDEETAIQAPDGTGPKITWSGPPLMPTLGKERFNFHLGSRPGTSRHDTLERLLGLGATRPHANGGCPGAIALADVDGNEVCLLESSRTSRSGARSVGRCRCDEQHPQRRNDGPSRPPNGRGERRRPAPAGPATVEERSIGKLQEAPLRAG